MCEYPWTLDFQQDPEPNDCKKEAFVPPRLHFLSKAHKT
jgi:hypothetical protein